MSEHDNPESGDITYWSDQCNKARRERDAEREAKEVYVAMCARLTTDNDHLRALLREVCQYPEMRACRICGRGTTRQVVRGEDGSVTSTVVLGHADGCRLKAALEA